MRQSGSSSSTGGPADLIAGATLQMRGVCKSFPGVQALSNVDPHVMPGEVLGLVDRANHSPGQPSGVQQRLREFLAPIS